MQILSDQGVRHCLGAILAGNVRHQAVALAVRQRTTHMHVSEVVGDHGFRILRIAQENIVETSFLDELLGPDMILLLNARIGRIRRVHQRRVDDFLHTGGFCRIHRITLRTLTFDSHERHGDERHHAAAFERLFQSLAIVEVRDSGFHAFCSIFFQ